MSIWLWLLLAHLIGLWLFASYLLGNIVGVGFEKKTGQKASTAFIISSLILIIWEIPFVSSSVWKIFRMIARSKYEKVKYQVLCNGKPVKQSGVESDHQYKCELCGQSLRYWEVKYTIRRGHQVDNPKLAEFKKSFWYRFV